MTDFVKNKEIKLKNKISPVLSKKDILRQFDEKIKSFLDKKEKYSFAAKELTLQFSNILSNPNVSKGPPDLEFEDQVLSRLIAFAQELNEDPDQPNDYGSYALFTIVIRSLLKLRDKCNFLEENTKEVTEKFNTHLRAHLESRNIEK